MNDGDGTERASIEAVFEREAPGRNRFLGELGPEEIAQLYASGDLCVWPAVNEAYGMAMLEAQAAGVPVVSRNVRGVPDVVRDGWTGLLALPGDEFELAACARDLLADPARRSAMGRAASQFVANERSLEATSSKLHKALEDLCRPGQRPGAAVRQ